MSEIRDFYYFGQQSGHTSNSMIGSLLVQENDIPYFYVKKISSVACTYVKTLRPQYIYLLSQPSTGNCSLVKITLCVASKRCTSSFSSVKIIVKSQDLQNFTENSRLPKLFLAPNLMQYIFGCCYKMDFSFVFINYRKLQRASVRFSEEFVSLTFDNCR